MPERIQKLLAAAGIDSRRNVERLVTEGRVAVNGKVARKLPILVDPEHDSVEVDGEPVKLGGTKRRRVYVLMHKPKGTVCTNKGQRTAVGDQRTAVDLLPPGFDKRVYPVGRLDAASTGLLLLTNDGPLTQQLTHPKFGVPKTYHVACDGHVGDEVIDALRAGVWLGDKEKRGTKMKAVKVEVLKRGRERTSLSVVLRRGPEPPDPPDARQARPQGEDAPPRAPGSTDPRRPEARPEPPADPPGGQGDPQRRRPRQAPCQARRRMSVSNGP